LIARPDSPSSPTTRAAARFGLLALVLALFALVLPATALGDEAATTFCSADCAEEQFAAPPADDAAGDTGEVYTEYPADEATAADETAASDPWAQSTPVTEPEEIAPPVLADPPPPEPVTPVVPPVNVLPIVPVEPVATEPVAVVPLTPAPATPVAPDVAPAPVALPTFERIAPSVAPTPVPVGTADMITGVGPSALPDAAPDLLAATALSEAIDAADPSQGLLNLSLSRADDLTGDPAGPLPSPAELDGTSLAQLLGAPAATALPFAPGFAPKSLFQAILTYVVPGDGGAYTATLAALLQLAVVLAVWLLLAPRPSSSPVPLLVASDSQGYRAVALRPG
jgi:hypothetical protein